MDIDRTRGGLRVADASRVLAGPYCAQMLIEREAYRGVGFPIKMGRTPATLRRLPPCHGEHTEEVLRETEFDRDHIHALCALDE